MTSLFQVLSLMGENLLIVSVKMFRAEKNMHIKEDRKWYFYQRSGDGLFFKDTFDGILHFLFVNKSLGKTKINNELAKA